MDSFPEEDLPPRTLTFYPIHLMIALGMFLVVFAAMGIFLTWRKRLFEDTLYSRLYLKLAVLTIPLPVIAMELGWMATEIGRQPWAVYGILRTVDAVSVSVPAEQILFSILLFTSIYALLFVLWILVLVKEIQYGPDVIEAPKSQEV